MTLLFCVTSAIELNQDARRPVGRELVGLLAGLLLPKIDVRKPCVYRRGQVEDKPKRQRGFDAGIASWTNHTVISPRWTSARSYADQFPTGSLVLDFGDMLDCISRSCNSVLTMARMSIVAHRGRGIRAPTP